MNPPARFEILDRLPDPVQIVDQEGRIAFMNQKMREMFGDRIGQVCYRSLKKSGVECQHCPRKVPDTREFRDRQVEIEAVNGRNFLVNHSTLRMGGQRYIVETYKDITEYKQLLQEDALVKAEVEVARGIQKRCITVARDVPGVAIEYQYTPSHLIAGDFLNVHWWKDRYLAIAVADVTGHGIGAAAVTFMLKIVYDQLCRERITLSGFMNEVQRRLHGYLLPGHFVTMAVVVIDLSTRQGRIINAGHPPVLHVSPGSHAIRRYPAQGLPIGMDPAGSKAMNEEGFGLAPGDRLVFYSDGIFQRFDRSLPRFLEGIQPVVHAPPEQFFSSVLPSAEVPIEDDITLLLVDVLRATERTGGSGSSAAPESARLNDNTGPVSAPHSPVTPPLAGATPIRRIPMSPLIDAKATVRQVVAQHPTAKAVFQKHGIDYCCGGGVDLATAAEKRRVPLDQLLEALAEAIAHPPPGAEADNRDWWKAPLTELCDYIEKRHHTFMHRELPRLHELLLKVVKAHSENHGAMLKALQRVYESLRAELEAHLQKEEQILFPYIRQTEAWAEGRGAPPVYHCGSLRNPIRQMEAEHEHAGQALAELRRVTNDYALPPDACPTFDAVYDGLIEMEDDLHQHIHLENNILFPRSVELEGKMAR